MFWDHALWKYILLSYTFLFWWNRWFRMMKDIGALKVIFTHTDESFHFTHTDRKASLGESFEIRGYNLMVKTVRALKWTFNLWVTRRSPEWLSFCVASTRMTCTYLCVHKRQLFYERYIQVKTWNKCEIRIKIVPRNKPFKLKKKLKSK